MAEMSHEILPGAALDVAVRHQQVVTFIGDDEQVEIAIEEAESVEPTAQPASGSRRAKAPRKGAGRRASAPKVAKVTDLARHVEAEMAVPVTDEQEVPIPLVPLFEPEPFVRQQRAVFGRKAG